jgi:hypothetical protein
MQEVAGYALGVAAALEKNRRRSELTGDVMLGLHGSAATHGAAATYGGGGER